MSSTTVTTMSTDSRHRRLRRPIVLGGLTALALLAPAVPSFGATGDTGLFGAGDPTYDGVYRQSSAIIGLQEAGARIPRAAVTWLLRQQCADGSFVAYRANTTTPCPAPDPANFTGPDSNSTAMAAMALAAAGEQQAADRAGRALVAAQNADGGWGYVFGGASDTNSTGLVLAALDASTNAEAKSERRGLGWLRSAVGTCSRGVAGLPFQKGGAGDAYASAQALLGMNTGLPMQETHAQYTPVQRCTVTLDQQLANFLVGELREGNGRISSSMDPTKPDNNATAWTVIALIGADRPPAQVRSAVRALTADARTFVGTGAAASPAAAGILSVVAERTGRDARAFGGVDLVTSILTSIRK